MRRHWTEKDKEILSRLYPTMPVSMISEVLCRSPASIYNQAFIMQLKKAENFQKSEFYRHVYHNSDRPKFTKGHIPWNKDLRYSPISQKGTFKKGNLPKQTLYDGAITIRYMGTEQQPYKYIRTSLAKWQLLHHKTWSDAHGPVPRGMIVSFRDGNTMNCDLNNLKLLSRAENMQRNSIHRYPPEIKRAMHLNNKLKKLIEHEKNNNVGSL